MHKLLKSIIVLLILNGCTQAPKDEVQDDVPSMGVVNPIKTYDTLEEVNSVVGTSLVLLDGASEVRYTTINNTVAQVDFIYNDYELCLRASFAAEGAELAGTYGEYQETATNDYIVMMYEFGTVVAYDVGDEHRTLFIKNSTDDEQVNSLINILLK